MEKITRPKKIIKSEQSVQSSEFIQKNMQMQINNIYSKLDEIVNYLNNPNLFGNSIELSAPQPYIDFHFDNSSEDYTSRIIEERKGMLTSAGPFKFNKGIVFDNNAIKFKWNGTHLELYVDNTYIGNLI